VEAIFVAAANCAGSDDPMLAAHFRVPLDCVELVVEGVFDPRGEFDGLDGFQAPPDAASCYLSLHMRVTVVSSAPADILNAIRRRSDRCCLACEPIAHRKHKAFHAERGILP
jgi:hypothetical protein